MSNDITQNPWSIDTASATALFSGQVWIEKLQWRSPTTAGHQCIVQDKNGSVIWSKYALAGGDGIDYGDDFCAGNYEGLLVPTLGSGTLYIHIK